MSSSNWSREDWNRFLDETAFLLYSMPALEAVRGKPGAWNQFGEKIAIQMERDGGANRSLGESLWYRAKRAIHIAMTGSDAKYAGIKTRIHRSPAVSANVLSELSLWLAGELRVSISVTKRLVAVMLIGVAESKGDWVSLGD